MSNKKTIVLYPFLISIYPILALLAYNTGKLKVADALRSLVLSLGIAALFLLASKGLLKDWHRAGLLASLFVLLFFSYGHIYNNLEQISLLGFMLGRHRILIPIWLALFAVGYWAASRTRLSLTLNVQTLNVVAAFLVALPVAQLVFDRISTAPDGQVNPEIASLAELHLAPSANQALPDVYYIVTDGYTRADSLMEYYGFDNSPFLKELEELGFYIAFCSQSNYSQSDISISSSLNANYVETYFDQVDPENTSTKGLGRMARMSLAREAFEALGYTFVSFESGYFPLHMEDADIYLRFHASDIQEMLDFGSLNNFESLLVRTSAGLIVADGIFKFQIREVNLGDLPRDTRNRERIIFAFDKLGELGDVQGPKFVFAHIFAPHEPYVLGPDGETLDADISKVEGYPLQVQYVNRRVFEAVEKILAASEIPPIIVIQGDHGSYHTNPTERMTITNAYYLPNGGDQLLYPTITPVNTFRLIFNYYFGGDYELLEDKSFYSAYQTPFVFELIPNTCLES